MNETIHNFRKGEFGVQNIEINEKKGLIEIDYGVQEGGQRKVLIPIENIEKCEFMVKNEWLNQEQSEENPI